MFRTTCFTFLLVAATGICADPASPQRASKVGPKVEAKPNSYLQAAAEAEMRERKRIASLINLLAASRPRLEAFILSKQDPNLRMTKLLNESEDLRQAREEMHRFWMNNQPAVLTYERLNGAIDPGPVIKK